MENQSTISPEPGLVSSYMNMTNSFYASPVFLMIFETFSFIYLFKKHQNCPIDLKLGMMIPDTSRQNVESFSIIVPKSVRPSFNIYIHSLHELIVLMHVIIVLSISNLPKLFLQHLGTFQKEKQLYNQYHKVSMSILGLSIQACQNCPIDFNFDEMIPDTVRYNAKSVAILQCPISPCGHYLNMLIFNNFIYIFYMN